MFSVSSLHQCLQRRKSPSFTQTTTNCSNLLVTNAIARWFLVQCLICNQFYSATGTTCQLGRKYTYFPHITIGCIASNIVENSEITRGTSRTPQSHSYFSITDFKSYLIQCDFFFFKYGPSFKFTWWTSWPKYSTRRSGSKSKNLDMSKSIFYIQSMLDSPAY